jgi:integrase
VRKAVFALRQCLGAAVEDNRIRSNAALAVPLPSERQKPPRFLSQREVERLIVEMPGPYKVLVLLGAYTGLRLGEAVGLTRSDVDVLRSRVTVSSTAVEVKGAVTLGNEPKTARSRRSIPVARSVMRRVETHLDQHVAPEPGALLFVGPAGGPLFRSFGLRVLKPAVTRAGLGSITFHGLRHSFVAILVAAGCNVREVRVGGPQQSELSSR